MSQTEIVTHLLFKSLKKRNHELDLWGVDRRVLSTAYQDFINYLKFHWKIEDSKMSKFKLSEKIKKYYREKPEEFIEFTEMWSGIWMKKWNERVKLIIRGKDIKNWKRASELFRKAEPVWRGLRERNKIKDIVIEALIRNGEICGTSILAESMLKIEIGLSIERNIQIEGHEHLLNMVNKVLKRAREASQSKGPLIYIRIGKRFFQLLRRNIR